jgi:hypothetical protein
MSDPKTSDGPKSSDAGSNPKGEVIDTKAIPTSVPVAAWEIAIIIAIVVVGGLVLTITYLVVAGKLDQIYLTALVADAESGLVLATVYLLVIELRRDREEREGKEKREREAKGEAERARATNATADAVREVKQLLDERLPSGQESDPEDSDD